MPTRFFQRPIAALVFVAVGIAAGEIGGCARLYGAESADGCSGLAVGGDGGLVGGCGALVGEFGDVAVRAWNAGLVGLVFGMDAAGDVDAGGAG